MVTERTCARFGCPHNHGECCENHAAFGQHLWDNWWVKETKGTPTMDPEQAQELGRQLRERREELGLSIRQLAARCGLNDVTVLRLERGEKGAPRADTLARIASELGLGASDLFILADYVTPADLPTLAPYLRTKYRDLPPGAVDDIEAYAARLADRHGVSLEGPALGEDEQPEPSATNKKGGT